MNFVRLWNPEKMPINNRSSGLEIQRRQGNKRCVVCGGKIPLAMGRAKYCSVKHRKQQEHENRVMYDRFKRKSV